MPDFQIKKSAKEYDVCIIGSGAGGGMAAYTLANAGVKVVMLEAGPMYDPAKNVTQLKWPYESPRRGASTKHRHFGDFDAAYAVGNWMANLTPTKMERNSIGSDHACWADAQTTGVEFHFALDREILNIKVMMALEMTGPLAMTMWRPTMIK